MIFLLTLNVLAHEVPPTVRAEVDAWKQSVQARLAEHSDFVNSLRGDPARAKDARDFLASLEKSTGKSRYALDFDRDGKLTTKDWELGNRRASNALFQTQIKNLLAQEDLLKAFELSPLAEEAKPQEILAHAILLKDKVTLKTQRALQEAGLTLLTYQYWGKPDAADFERRKELLGAWNAEAFTKDYPDLSEEVTAPNAAKMAQLESYLQTQNEFKLPANQVTLSVVDYLHARDLWVALGSPKATGLTGMAKGLEGRPAVAAWVRGANPNPEIDKQRTEVEAQKKFLADELRTARAIGDKASVATLNQALNKIDRQRHELIRASFGGQMPKSAERKVEAQKRSAQLAAVAKLSPAEDTANKLLELFAKMPDALAAGAGPYGFAHAQLN